MTGPADRVLGLRMDRADLRAWLSELVQVLKSPRAAGATMAQALESCERPLPDRAALFLAVLAAGALERAGLSADEAEAVAFHVLGSEDEVALGVEVVPRRARPGLDN